MMQSADLKSLGLIALMLCGTVFAAGDTVPVVAPPGAAVQDNSLEWLEQQAKSDPHGALVQAEAVLKGLPASSGDRPQYEAIAAEAAVTLVLPEPALHHAEAGLALTQSQGPLRQRLFIAKANGEEILGRPKNALKTINTVLITLESGQFPSWLTVEALSTRASLSVTLEDFRSALADLLRAYGIAEPAGRRGRRDDVSSALGNVYAAMHDYEHAVQYYREALTSQEPRHELVLQSITEFSLAVGLVHTGHVDEAERYFNLSREHSKQMGDEQGVAYADSRLADMALTKKNYDLAERLYRSALPAFVATQDISPQGAIALGLSEIALSRGQYSEAQAQAKKALQLGLQGDEKERQVRAHILLSKVYLATKDYHSAYDSSEAAHQLKEKMLEATREQSVTEMSVRFDSERQKQENEILRQKSLVAAMQLSEQKQRTGAYVFAVVTLLILVAFLVYGGHKNRQLRDHLSKLAHSDALTGIANRRRILAVMGQEFVRARRYSFQLSIVMIDLDHFKSINDKFGHDAGDEVLREFASMVQGHLRLTDAFGRLGGEEFVIIFPHTGVDAAAMVTERLRVAMSSLVCSKLRGEQQPTFSAGVAAQSADDADADALSKRADDAVYAAKNQGRNRVVVS